MNIRLGLFRLWVVASVLFVIGTAVVSYSGIREEFRRYADWNAGAQRWYSQLPLDCRKARGTNGNDYADTSLVNGLCWYRMQDFRRLYPEYKDLNNRVLVEKLYTKAGQPLEDIRPWNAVTKTAGIAFGVPLAFLVLGWSLLWAIAGFRGSGPH